MYKDYNSIEKFLHNLSLSSKEIKKIFFFLEKKIFGNNMLINNQSNNIFLGGLPRCGSTAILYFLNDSNEFGALKYRNMPFILSPKINQIIFNNLKKISIKERTHGDGLKFSLNTPEAFDEIFFSIFTDVEDKILSENYYYYINQVLKLQNKNRYLSKNNNLYKRIDFLSNYFEKSNKLFIIRNPYNQSCSLLRQHLKFCELQKKDVFVKKYMNYLYHNEFGLNHIAWNNPTKYNSTLDIHYWLEQWYLYYLKLFDKINNGEYKNLYYIIYEEISKPSFIENIKRILKIENLHQNLLIVKNTTDNKNGITDDKLLKNCFELYNEFYNSNKNILNN